MKRRTLSPAFLAALLGAIPVGGAEPPKTAAAGKEAVLLLTPPAPPEPRINGPKVYGVRHGVPFLYRIPATGQRPMTFAAEGLPQGLTLDPATGIVSGRVKSRGEYPVTLVATNARGRAKRPFCIMAFGNLALTPPMGWNSWYIHYERVNDKIMREAADQMIASGMADLGYQYVNIDEGWSIRPGDKNPDHAGPPRNPDGSIRPNRRFPDMKSLTDYIHAKGLKAGLHSSPGETDCGGNTGCYGYEAQNARAFARWGFDFLKYDWCSYGAHQGGNRLANFQRPYRLMWGELQKLDRDVVFNLCQYGMADVWTWGGNVGHCWRTTGDLGCEKAEEMPGFFIIGRSNAQHWQFARPGAWNDPDYILIGWVGDALKGGLGEPTKLTAPEQYLYMSMWSLMAAPLIFSGDMAKLDALTLNVLCNHEVIEVDQDPLGRQARIVRQSPVDMVLAKDLEDGSLAVGLFNLRQKPAKVSVTWAELGVQGPQRVRDLWRQKDLNNASGTLEIDVPRHGAAMLRLEAAKLEKSDMFRISVATCVLAAGVVMLSNSTAMAQPAATAPAQPFPGKHSNYKGYDCYDFTADGRPTIVVIPAQTATGAPWIWRAEFFDAFPQVDLALLAKGFHLVYINVGNTFGCPDALKHWDVLYRELTEKHGLSRKPVLEGLSRGGLYCFNWAASHPEKVACILADNAVLDFKSWPGGKGKGKGSPGDWKELLADYHFQSEAEALAYRKNPVDNLEPLARVKVPLFLLCGDADDVVPYPENGAIVKQRYEKLGGPVTVLIKQGLGHHPHGLADPTPAVEFILEHTLPPGAPVVTTLKEQAGPADTFVDSIGVNVHLAYTDTSYRNYAEVIKPRLREVGIRHIRDGCPPAWNKEFMTRLNDLAAAGVRSLLICSPHSGTLEQMVATLKQVSASVEAVEGPNEPDGAGISYRGHGFPQGVRDFQDDLYAAVKRDPATRGLPVVATSMSNPESAAKLGLLTSGDYANTHSYADGGPPGFRWDWYMERCRTNCQRPVMATETGYHNAPNHTDGLWIPGISEAAAGKYVSRLLPEYFARGVVRTYLYELLDLRVNPRDAESNLGIVRANGTPKPAFIAVKNLIALLADPGPPFTPGVLRCRLSGQQRSPRHLLLQKRDGRYELLLWINVPAYDTQAKRDLDVPPQPVVVHFDRPVRAAKAFLPFQGMGPVREFPATDRLAVEVPDHVLVLEITP